MQGHPATLDVEAIDAGVFVAGQLMPQDMPALAGAGLRSVINNRPDGEGGADQPDSAQLEAAARAAGLEYRYVPVPPAGHGAADARRMSDAVDALPKPVLAFCRTGRRAAALYLMARQGT